MKRYALLAILLFSSTFGLNAAAFTNGSFELNAGGGRNSGGGFITLAAGSPCITGWSIGPNSLDYINSHWVADDGTRSLDLNGNQNATSISQTFDTALGGLYLVSFAMAGNPDGPPIIKNLNVSVAGFSGNYSFDTTGKTRADMGWVTQAFSFVGAGSTATLTFTSTTEGCCYGPALDNVSVAAAPVPEPGSIVMMGMAAALFVVGRRKLFRK